MGRSTEAAGLARALGDPLRIAILHRLMEGPAAVAELVAQTGEPQPKVSNHLATLRERKLVVSRRTRRQVVYELRQPSVAQLVETLLAIAGPPAKSVRLPSSIALARTCYDHLAGRLGVAVLDRLMGLGAIVSSDRVRGDLRLGPTGAELFGRLGVDTKTPVAARRRFAFDCLDWTERRHHLGGWLGARLCERALRAGWVVRHRTTRAVLVTLAGRRALKRYLGLVLNERVPTLPPNTRLEQTGA